MTEEEVITTPESPEAQTQTATAEPPAEVSANAEVTTTKPRRKKVKRTVAVGQLHILATFNNTIITFTDVKGAALTTSSSGTCGFRGSKKGTAYAAQVATERAGQAAKQTYSLSKVDVFVKGIGLGRDAAIRALSNLDMQVESIRDVTGVAHGGVRPRKARRV